MASNEDSICPKCYYHGGGRMGPKCNFDGTLRPHKKECEHFVPAEERERKNRAEIEGTKLIVEMVNLLADIKMDDLLKIPDENLRGKLQEIVLLAKQIKKT